MMELFSLGAFPTLGGLLTFLTVVGNVVLSFRTKREVGTTRQEVTIVKEYVNGNLKKMQSRIEALESRVETLMLMLAAGSNPMTGPIQIPPKGGEDGI